MLALHRESAALQLRPGGIAWRDRRGRPRRSHLPRLPRIRSSGLARLSLPPADTRPKEAAQARALALAWLVPAANLRLGGPPGVPEFRSPINWLVYSGRASTGWHSPPAHRERQTTAMLSIGEVDECLPRKRPSPQQRYDRLPLGDHPRRPNADRFQLPSRISSVIVAILPEGEIASIELQVDSATRATNGSPA